MILSQSFALSPNSTERLALLLPSFTNCTRLWPKIVYLTSQVSQGGVVRDPVVHQEVITKVVDACEALSFHCKGWTESPIKGASAGNTEFLIYFKRETTPDSGQ